MEIKTIKIGLRRNEKIDWIKLIINRKIEISLRGNEIMNQTKRRKGKIIEDEEADRRRSSKC